ncbi:MAG: hypothetical protein EAZ89_07265 [Bacteroidetes bacterium]|nr:MAG: hypothetical protein EAZ89_07265 [Bacteroidota bacterium]
MLALILFYNQPGETLVQGPKVRVVKTPASGPGFEEAPELVQARSALARLRSEKHPSAATESEIARLQKNIRLHQSIGDVKARLQDASFTSASLRQEYEEQLTRMEAELSLPTQ